MARGVNKVILLGVLGKDPDCRFYPSGDAVTTLSLATSESWKDKQTGENQERTEWHRIVFSGRRAELAGEFLRKGSKVYIEGSLQTKKYQKNNVDHYRTEIRGDQFQMLDGAPQGGTQQEDYRAHAGSNQQNPTAERSPAAFNDFDAFDDDIPF